MPSLHIGEPHGCHGMRRLRVREAGLAVLGRRSAGGRIRWHRRRKAGDAVLAPFSLRVRAGRPSGEGCQASSRGFAGITALSFGSPATSAAVPFQTRRSATGVFASLSFRDAAHALGVPCDLLVVALSHGGRAKSTRASCRERGGYRQCVLDRGVPRGALPYYHSGCRWSQDETRPSDTFGGERNSQRKGIRPVEG